MSRVERRFDQEQRGILKHLKEESHMSKSLFSWYEKHAQSGQQVESIALLKKLPCKNMVSYLTQIQNEIQKLL